MKYCDYGCQKEANFKLKNNKLCCSKSPNKCIVNREKNSQGLKDAYKTGKRDSFTFSEKDREKSIVRKKEQALDRLLEGKCSTLTNNAVRKILVEQLDWDDKTCKNCGISSWQGKPLKMHMDHIDGNNMNNSIENLRFLCPNCHTQTDTYCGKNINSGKVKVTDKDLFECLSTTNNIRQALIKAGLSPKGGNYTRATKLSALVEKLGVEVVKFDETGSIATSSQADNSEGVET